jgi:8-oxo-dGTP pyrophosphatase MutT (NUDIX family)
MVEDRSKLPFRKNCEGYFVSNGKILARDTGKGFIEFPGGGIDVGEDPQKALTRETKEETGAIVENLEKIGQINFVWGENWAKTDKQRKRYNEFQGEEMHFFKGNINEFSEVLGDGSDEGWKGEVLMDVQKVLDKILEGEPFDEDIKDYREFQIKTLRRILK